MDKNPNIVPMISHYASGHDEGAGIPGHQHTLRFLQAGYCSYPFARVDIDDLNCIVAKRRND
jgi:hypothetical protein